MQFNNWTTPTNHQWQLDAEIAWSLKPVSVSDRFKNISFTKVAAVFCLKVAFWQDLMQGKWRLWLCCFIQSLVVRCQN